MEKTKLAQIPHWIFLQFTVVFSRPYKLMSIGTLGKAILINLWNTLYFKKACLQNSYIPNFQNILSLKRKKYLLQRFFVTEKKMLLNFFDTYINVAGKFKSMLDWFSLLPDLAKNIITNKQINCLPMCQSKLKADVRYSTLICYNDALGFLLLFHLRTGQVIDCKISTNH